jgi:hypothetical protein
MAVMTAIALGTAIGGAVMSGVGQIKAGNAAARAAESQAQQLEFNAGVADLQAQDATQRGLEEEQRFRTQVRGLVGSQRSALAAQGIDVGSGSAADVQADTAYLGELDARKIRANAQREAWGYEVEAADLRMGADVARKGGQAAKSASRWGVANTVLGTGSSLLMSRYGWDRRVTTQRTA